MSKSDKMPENLSAYPFPLSQNPYLLNLVI
jgi:hypothetical protein